MNQISEDGLIGWLEVVSAEENGSFVSRFETLMALSVGL